MFLNFRHGKNEAAYFASNIAIIDYLTKDTQLEISETSVAQTSNKKIAWGIKRNSEHQQPDVGSANKKTLEENNGICLGDKDEKVIYLTFNNGYEAGYTNQILDTLKINGSKSHFFHNSTLLKYSIRISPKND